MFDRANPKLFGDFHVSRVHEAAQLAAVHTQEVEHVVHVEVDRVAQIERLPRGHFFILDQRLKHLLFGVVYIYIDYFSVSILIKQYTQL